MDSHIQRNILQRRDFSAFMTESMAKTLCRSSLFSLFDICCHPYDCKTKESIIVQWLWILLMVEYELCGECIGGS